VLAGLRSRVSPPVAVAVIALSSFAVWAALGYAASAPRFFMDELYYMKAGVSLAQGHGLQFEGTSWGYGPIFPLVIAGLVRATSSQETTYELIKVANAAFFALASAPIYLLARRVLAPWPSVAVVALCALMPSSMYASVSMTESLGYLAACWTIYATLRALERPSVTRQVVAVGATAVSVGVRPQLVALFAAYLAGLGLALAIGPTSWRSQVRKLWPTWLAVVVGVAWVARPLVQGKGVGTSLGSYSSLAQSYDPLQIAKWFSYHVGDLALYLGVAPLVVAPIVLVGWWKRARQGSERDAALVSLFVAENLIGIGLIAAFASTSFGLGILYDRYLFYLVPLWLIAFISWICDGMLKPVRPLVVGVAASVIAVATLPFGVVARSSWFQHFEAVATGLWGKVGLVVAHVPHGSVRVVGLVFASVVAGAVVALTRRHAWVLVTVVAGVLIANSALSWRSAFVPRSTYGLDAAGPRNWIDRAVGPRQRVAVLVVARPCPEARAERFSSLEADYFNRSVRDVVYLGGEGGSAATALTLRSDGALVRNSGAIFWQPYVVAPPGVVLAGERLATGMATNLVLWHVGDRARVQNARSNQELLATACTG
jgi:hypothetical protein